MFRSSQSQKVKKLQGECLKSQAGTSIRRDTQQWRVKPSAACSYIHSIYRLTVSRSVFEHSLSAGCTCVTAATKDRVAAWGCFIRRDFDKIFRFAGEKDDKLSSSVSRTCGAIALSVQRRWDHSSMLAHVPHGCC